MKAVKRFGVCLLGMLLLSGCSSQPVQEQESMNKNFFAMNTYISFTIYTDVPESVLDTVEAEIKDLESLWSVTDEGSEVYRINHAEGAPITINEKTAELLNFSLKMFEQTDGALDVTIYPVLTAWGFTTGSYQIPSEELLSEKMQLIGADKVSLSGNILSMQSGMQLDFGAVAKGYASDLITELLKENGVTSAVFSLGGNIQVIGNKPDGNDFRISVQHPGNRDSLGILSLSDSSISTSGTYERYFIGEDGQQYGHILDPKTGRPMISDLTSVTVVGKEGKLCDALSTALFVKGLDGAVQYYQEQYDSELLFEHGGFELLLMTEDGEIYLTEGLENCFTAAESYRDLPIHIIRR